jgi:hypothetical protein
MVTMLTSTPTRTGHSVRWLAGAFMVAACVSAGCTADHVAARPALTSGPQAGHGSAAFLSSSPSPSPTCTGHEGQPLLRSFFDDLSNGRKDLLATYVVQPQDFTRWSDPTSGRIRYMPGPGNETETLDALQTHLDSLQRQGAVLVLTRFDDAGYQGNDPYALGGGFTFQMQGRADRHETMTQGDGKGLIDCATGKLKELVILNW